MNKVVLSCIYYWELEHAVAAFDEYYNHERYYEAVDNLTPADVYFGRSKDVLTHRELIKQVVILACNKRQKHQPPKKTRGRVTLPNDLYSSNQQYSFSIEKMS